MTKKKQTFVKCLVCKGTGRYEARIALFDQADPVVPLCPECGGAGRPGLTKEVMLMALLVRRGYSLSWRSLVTTLVQERLVEILIDKGEEALRRMDFLISLTWSAKRDHVYLASLLDTVYTLCAFFPTLKPEREMQGFLERSRKDSVEVREWMASLRESFRRVVSQQGLLAEPIREKLPEQLATIKSVLLAPTHAPEMRAAEQFTASWFGNKVWQAAGKPDEVYAKTLAEEFSTTLDSHPLRELTEEERRCFSELRVVPALPGLTPGLLANLLEATRAYGARDRDGYAAQLHLNYPVSLKLETHLPHPSASLYVFNAEGRIGPPSHLLAWKGHDELGGGGLWHASVSIEDAKTALVLYDLLHLGRRHEGTASPPTTSSEEVLLN